MARMDTDPRSGQPWHREKVVTLFHGRCLEVLAGMDEESVDAVVCDPPYGLKFMGKRWDYQVPSVAEWAAVLRVLKPGGQVISFSSPRTYHRMAVKVEDAGFEIRDMLEWLYGSGFPKSLNLEGEFEGLGTALKPAHEPMVLSRKPFAGTVQENVRKFGVGALNIAGCRVDSNGEGVAQIAHSEESEAVAGYNGGLNGGSLAGEHFRGRWPANLVHDGSEPVVAIFPAEAGGGFPQARTSAKTNGIYEAGWQRECSPGPADMGSGSAARFFYCAKATRGDRDEGLEGLEEFVELSAGEKTEREEGTAGICAYAGARAPGRNMHPTVKPVSLMRWLVRLVTPKGGVVLDPWMGSGSTGKACVLEGMRFVGIEMEELFCRVARARIGWAQRVAREEAARPVQGELL